MAAAAATAGPVVQLPSQPIPANALTASELQRKLLTLKEETNVHVSNLHSTMLQVRLSTGCGQKIKSNYFVYKSGYKVVSAGV